MDRIHPLRILAGHLSDVDVSTLLVLHIYVYVFALWMLPFPIVAALKHFTHDLSETSHN